MRTRYKILNDISPYFITSTIIDWIPIFSSDKYYNILIDTIKFYQSRENLEVLAYVFLPDHFHLIAWGKELAKTIQLIKMYSAKEILKELKSDNKDNILTKLMQSKKQHKINSKYQVWQEGFNT